MKTGIAGLDTVLDGGFLYHNSILLKGRPGTGKTTLGIQMIHSGAVQYGEPGIIVLFEQFPQQLYRDLASFNWNIEEVVNARKIAVHFARIEDIATTNRVGEPPLVSQIHTMAEEIGARRILVDGLSNFMHMLQTDEASRRTIVLKFINSIKSIGLTPILTAEAENEEGHVGFEEYLADSVVSLSNPAPKDSTFQTRWLEVRKSRGQSHIRGRHPYKITERGIEVYPHLTPKLRETAPGTGDFGLVRVPSGVPGLDDLLGGGYTRGTSTIVAGMPGTFKTTLGAQFLAQGAEQDEPGSLLTLGENPEFLVKAMKGKGVDLAPHLENGRIAIRHYFPKAFYMDELLFGLEREVRERGTKRIVVDGINEIEHGIDDPATYKDFISLFLSLFSRHDVTSLFIQKLDRFTANAPLTNVKYASMFDGIIYTGTIEIESAVRKVISVLKMRGGAYVGDLREISCGAQGLAVTDKFLGLSGILAGNPQGQVKKRIEEVFQPLYFVRDFLEILRSSEMDEAQRQQILSNLLGEVGKLVERLKEHFDIKGELGKE